jgi:hypothetical protein
MPIPDDARLVGRHFYFQAGYVDLGAPQGVSFTSGLEVVLGS